MSKKGHTNNPGGRPPKPPGEKFETPKRFIRIGDEDYAEMQAVIPEGQTFTQWALAILLKAARRLKGKK